MTKLIKEDAINDAMISGLIRAFKEELKDELMQKADDLAESIINTICKRLELKMVNNHLDFGTNDRHIKLEWIINK